MTTIHAPGKLMLFGEHAVVYGHPCIVTAVDRWLTVSAQKTDGKDVVVEAPGVKDTRFVDEAVAAARRAWNLPTDGLHIRSESEFSGKYGFGSSAAVTVATIHALAFVYGKAITRRELFDLAYQVVLTVQGVGSGFDVASASHGGTLYYVKGGTTIDEMLLPQAIPLLVGYTGVKSNSVELVAQVAAKREKYRERVDRIMQAIAEVVGKGRQSMAEGDWERVGKYMDFNQEYLRDLGVSSEKLEALISAAKSAGAWGAKLSGAGGGDCMIAIAPPDKHEAVYAAIEKTGGEAVRLHAGAAGSGPVGTDDQTELFVVVDKDDTVLGYRTRYECHHDTTLIHRSANILLYDETGRILLQKRSSTKDVNPGMWTVSVTGHVAKGETYEQAAHREMKEELGIDAPLTFVKKFLFPYVHETEMEGVFEARYNGPFHPDPEEVETVAFVAKTELPRKLLSGEIVLTEFAQRVLREVGFLS